MISLIDYFVPYPWLRRVLYALALPTALLVVLILVTVLAFATMLTVVAMLVCDVWDVFASWWRARRGETHIE